MATISVVQISISFTRFPLFTFFSCFQLFFLVKTAGEKKVEFMIRITSVSTRTSFIIVVNGSTLFSLPVSPPHPPPLPPITSFPLLTVSACLFPGHGAPAARRLAGDRAWEPGAEETLRSL